MKWSHISDIKLRRWIWIETGDSEWMTGKIIRIEQCINPENKIAVNVSLGAPKLSYDDNPREVIVCVIKQKKFKVYKSQDALIVDHFIDLL